MPDIRTAIDSILRDRIAILDGSWGVLLQREVRGEEAYRGERFRDHPRDVAGNPDLLNVTQPEIVARIHDDYFAAGADIATTNTFTSTTIAQADYGLEHVVHELNVEGARLARRAADEWTSRTPDRPRFVAGSIGPLNVSLSLSPRVDEPAFRPVTFDQVRETYAHQIRGLREGGVDLLLIETVFDTLNCKAAIAAALDEAPELPLWLSFTAVDRSGRNLSGQTTEAFWASVEHARPLIVGVNCSLGGREMRPFVEELAHVATDLGRVLSERGPAERARRLRRAPGRHERLPRRVRARRARERRRRLLRHDAGSHPRDRGRRRRRAAAARAGAAPAHRLLRPRAVRDQPGHELRHGRRAHERDRVGAVPPPDRGRRLPAGASRSRSSRCAAAPTSST